MSSTNIRLETIEDLVKLTASRTSELGKIIERAVEAGVVLPDYTFVNLWTIEDEIVPQE